MKVLEKIFGKRPEEELPKLAQQKKICYPGYRNAEFASLRDAVLYLKRDGGGLEYSITVTSAKVKRFVTVDI